MKRPQKAPTPAYHKDVSLDKLSSANEGADSAHEQPSSDAVPTSPQQEIGGPKGPEPTRYGDWEKNGRCIDF